MTIEEKKAHVYRLVKLGMSRDEAELLAGFSLDEQEALERDGVYLARCRLQRIVEERDLLEHLDDVIEDNVLKGVSTELRWKLERMNPERWGKSLALSTQTPPAPAAVPDLSKLSREERAVLLAAVSKALPNGDVQ